MIQIRVDNPYYSDTLKMVDITDDRYEQFLDNKERGNEEYLIYVNEDNELCTFNPSNFALTKMLIKDYAKK